MNFVELMILVVIMNFVMAVSFGLKKISDKLDRIALALETLPADEEEP